MELRKYKLGEIAEITSSKRIFEKEYVEDGIPFIRGQEITDGSITNSSSRFLCYITPERYEELKKNYGVPQKNDILITAVGTIGNTYLVEDNKKFYFKDGNIIWFKNISADVYPKYLQFFMKSTFFNKQIEYSLIGAVQKALTIVMLSKIEIPLPTFQTQKKIAAVLSTLDNKIALNRRINEKLEQMAKRLYDHWFVQFDFPNADGKPYKSSGGKMVWNEVLKREIPEGWEVKSLGEVCDFPIERFSDKDISEKLYVPIEVIPRYEMSFSETANIEKAASGLCSFSKRSILLSNRRVYFHKVCIAPFEGITRDTVIIINSKDLNNLGFIYQIVNSNHFIDYATLNSYGSEQPVLSTPTVQDYKFVFPNNGIDKIYSKRVDSIINKVLENNLEIRKLTALRNRVLPLLMNGQVEVK